MLLGWSSRVHNEQISLLLVVRSGDKIWRVRIMCFITAFNWMFCLNVKQNETIDYG